MKKDEKIFQGEIYASDFVLRLVDVFRENGITFTVSGDDQLSVTEEGQTFTGKFTKTSYIFSASFREYSARKSPKIPASRLSRMRRVSVL